MDDIDAIQGHIEDIRELLQGFDCDEHNDEANPEHIQQAVAALDTLEGHVSDLVP
jgi:hypothetical protein